MRVRLLTGQVASAGTAALAAAEASVRAGGEPRDAQHEAVELLRALDALSAAVAGGRARTEEFLYATAVARGRGEVGVHDDGAAVGVRSDSDDTLPDLGDPERIRIAVLEAASEAAVATCTTTQAMSGRMTESNALRNRFPATLHALCDGLISARHAAIIRDRGERIAHDDDRAAYEHTLVPIARETTPGRLDRAARREAERYLREPLADRHRRARDARRVWITEDEDAMCILSARLPLVLGTGIHDRLTRYAKLLRHPADPRRLDHLRADVLSELLLTGVAPDADARHGIDSTRSTIATGSDAGPGGACPNGAGPNGATHDDEAPPGEHTATRGSGLSGIHAIRGRVAVTVPALTLLGRTDDPALLGGRSPIPIEQAATLLADAPTFTRILTHPMTGIPVGSDRHDPGAALREHLRTREHTAGSPGVSRRHSTATSTTPTTGSTAAPPHTTISPTSAERTTCSSTGRSGRRPTAPAVSSNGPRPTAAATPTSPTPRARSSPRRRSPNPPPTGLGPFPIMSDLHRGARPSRASDSPRRGRRVGRRRGTARTRARAPPDAAHRLHRTRTTHHRGRRAPIDPGPVDYIGPMVAKYDDASWHYGRDFPKLLPKRAASTHIGMFVAWCLLNGHASDRAVADLGDAIHLLSKRTRAMTPGRFLIRMMDEKFLGSDLTDEGNAFTHAYYEGDDDSLPYIDDYTDAAGPRVTNPYRVPDTWASYDRVAPRITARYEQWVAAGRPEFLT
ncbi:hypothetical protein HNR16_003369 [Pseudoclavibacter chungangensis]|uniref:DUF7832 domain-containing protein n=1 Tax=Pseudoclavibacter chungangensis TaxID=587635 RepID=UPI0015C6E4A6|nr:hypothetical protein [Pseudoclavibacter chungangensis]